MPRSPLQRSTNCSYHPPGQHGLMDKTSGHRICLSGRLLGPYFSYGCVFLAMARKAWPETTGQKDMDPEIWYFLHNFCYSSTNPRQYESLDFLLLALLGLHNLVWKQRLICFLPGLDLALSLKDVNVALCFVVPLTIYIQPSWQQVKVSKDNN